MDFKFNDDKKYKDIISAPTKTEQILLKEFEDQKEFIRNMSRTYTQTNVVQNARKERALIDFEYFVMTYLPHHCTENNRIVPLAPFHLEAVKRVDTDDNFIGLFQWARGHAKTTLSMFIMLWMIIRKKVNNLIYVSKSKEFSVSQLQNIQAELENNALLLEDFGPFKEKGADWRADRFVIPSFEFACSALGRGTSPRGIKFRNHRPDFIIIDDIDDDENSRNPRRVRQLIQWWNSELKPTTGLKYKIIVIGNKFSDDSLIAHFEKNIPNIYKTKINAIDDNNQSSWASRFSMKHWLREKEIMGRIAFEREYMNNPIIEGILFKSENIHLKKMDIEDYEQIVLYVDPSWSDTSDYKSVVVIGKKDGEFHIIDIFLKKSSMGLMVDWCFKFYIRNYDKTSISVYMEANAGQNYLSNEFEFAEKQYGLTLPLIMDRKNKIDKYARIEGMTPFFERNKVFFNEILENTPEFKEALTQLLGYEKGATLNDDFPDCLQGAITKINMLGGDGKRFEPLMTLRNDDFEW